MKLKLEKKQVPLFVGLSVVTVGMLGYATYSLLGGGAPKPAQAQQPLVPAESRNPELTAKPGEIPGLPPLSPTFRPDPFKPTVTLADNKPAAGGPAPKPASAPVRPAPPEKVGVRVAERGPLPSFPAPEFTPAAWPPAPAPVAKPVPAVLPAPQPAPAAPPAPVRPVVTVAGIVVGENPVAILRFADAQRQVVQLQDRVSEYVVDEITENAVVLVAGQDRWRLFLED